MKETYFSFEVFILFIFTFVDVLFFGDLVMNKVTKPVLFSERICQSVE